MARELNPKDEMAKRQEESRRRMEKNLPDEPPVDQLRVEQIEAFLADPVAYLKKAFIDQQYQPRDTELVKLLLLARILEEIRRA